MIKKYFFQKHNLVLFSFFLFSFSFAQTTETYDQPGTYTFTVPAGVISVKVQAWGAGSGGNNNEGRGGGGGAFAGNNSIAVTPGATYTVIVGSGGARGTGNSGEDSRFANLVIAKGGLGANGGSATSSTGDTKFSGGNGGISEKKAGAGGGGSGGAEGAGKNGGNPSDNNTGGNGGAAGLGGGAKGGAGGNNRGDGADGSFPGGGGGEKAGNGGSSGAGGHGQVIITYTPISYLAKIISADTGSSTWCAGETRNVSVTIKNIGNQPWTDVPGGKDFNIGIKWNQNTTSWNDYHVRVDAGNLAPGDTKTYNFTITAADNVLGAGYTSPLAAGNNNLTFDVVYEGKFWFGNTTGNTVYKSPNQTISALPDAPTGITPNSGVSICYGSSTNIKAISAGNFIDWYTSPTGGTKIGTSNSGADFSVSPTVNTVYYAEARNGSGCVSASRTATAEVKINPSPVATVTSNNQICAGADATFTLTGTPGATVMYTINGGSPSTVILTGGNATVTIPSVAVDQSLKIISVSNGSCTNSTEVSTFVTVGAQSVYTKDNRWTNGLPSDNGLNAVIEGNYNTSLGNIKACNCTVQPGGILTVSKGTVLKIENALLNSGTLTVESDGNLIQVNDAAVNSGNILVKRDLVFRSDERKEFNYIISPVEDANLKTKMYRKADGTSVVAPYALYHNEANNFFYASSGAYIKGRSLAVMEPPVNSGAVPTAFFEGKAFNGIINYNLAYSGAQLGYNLVGNPYPSNLDLNLLYADNKNDIKSTFTFWDNTVNDLYVQQGSSYKGNSYAMRNAAAGTEGTGLPAPGRGQAAVGSSKKPGKIVKTGQGFMVKALGTGRVLKYSNSLRSENITNTVFFGKKAQDDRYWLQLTAPSGIASTIALVYFSGGNSAFGIDDSPAMGGSDALYSFADNEKVAINGRAPFTTDDKINLGSSHFIKGSYTIALGDREGIFANGQKIYLKDKLTGVITNLSEGDYTFNANAGENTGRFEIVYKYETVLAVDSNVADELSVYRDGGNFVVKAQSKKLTGLELYDIAGRLIYKTNPNSLQAEINGGMLTSGMYILKADQHGVITAKKIVK